MDKRKRNPLDDLFDDPDEYDLDPDDEVELNFWDALEELERIDDLKIERFLEEINKNHMDMDTDMED